MKGLVLLAFVNLLFSLPGFAQGKDAEIVVPSLPGLVAVYEISYSFDNAPTVIRNIRFIQYINGSGLFVPANVSPTTPDYRRMSNRALWDMPQPFFLSFSGEVRLPASSSTEMETGTLAFKAINGNTGLMHGRVVFIQNNAGPLTTPTNLYTIRTGTFTAVQVPVTPTAKEDQ